MSFAGLLPHTARIQRSEGENDRFGQPSTRRYEAGELPCRLTASRGGETFTDRSRDVIRATHTLFLEPGADIKESDMVTVEDATSGTVLLEDANVMLVRKNYDLTSEHHREASLLVIRGSE